MSGARGFSFVELLLALGLLSIGLVATIPLLVTGMHQNAAARDLTIAATLAADRAESLKTVALGSLSSGTDVVDGRPVRYARTWTVEAGVPAPGLTSVTVTVTPLRARPERPSGAVTIRILRAR